MPSRKRVRDGLCQALRACSSHCFGMNLDDVASEGILGQRADLGCRMMMEDRVTAEGPLMVILAPPSPLHYSILPPLPLQKVSDSTQPNTSHSRGPGTGVRPSFKALAISAAFHLAYCCFCSSSSLIPFGASKQRSTSMNCAATTNLRIVDLHRLSRQRTLLGSCAAQVLTY